jgi:hypothetical protein
METDPGDRCAEKQDPRPAQWRRPRPIGQALEVETKDTRWICVVTFKCLHLFIKITSYIIYMFMYIYMII